MRALFLTIALIIFMFSLSAVGRAAAPATALGSIHILIVDEAEIPVAGAKVELRFKDGRFNSAVSNEKGEVRFSNVAAGAYRITTSMEGFESLSNDVTVINSSVELRFKLIQKIQVKESV